jgi:hypothetical protein
MNYTMSTTTSPHSEPVTMRRAATGDAARIRELALLDNKRLPAGPFLVADVAGEVVAAVSLSSGSVVADPFRPTADAVAMLHLRLTQMATVGRVEARPFAQAQAQREHQFAVAA